MRVFLADAEPDVRSALYTLLMQQPGVDVVGEADRAHGLLDRIGAANPDLVLLDWDLPGEPVTDLLLSLSTVVNSPPSSGNARLKVIALCVRPEVEQAALAAGADAFISKTDPPERLLTTVHGFFPPPASRLCVSDHAQRETS